MEDKKIPEKIFRGRQSGTEGFPGSKSVLHLSRCCQKQTGGKVWVPFVKRNFWLIISTVEDTLRWTRHGSVLSLYISISVLANSLQVANECTEYVFLSVLLSSVRLRINQAKASFLISLRDVGDLLWVYSNFFILLKENDYRLVIILSLFKYNFILQSPNHCSFSV